MDSIVIIIIAIAVACIVVAIAFLCKSQKKVSTLTKKVDGLNESIYEHDNKMQELVRESSELEQKLKETLQETEQYKESSPLKELANKRINLIRLSAANQRFVSVAKELKSKLSKAGDDLEDAEDEAAQYKKKCEKQKEQVSELNLCLGNCEKELQECRRAIEEKEAEIKEIGEKCGRQEESLKILNEILQAKDIDNKDIKESHKNIEAVEEFVKGELRDTFKEIGIEYELVELEKKIWQWANLQRKSWIKKDKVIAFVGEFSAGKTSIVNRILSLDNDDAPKLPVSSKATTAIATYISYNTDFVSLFTTPEGRLKNISKKNFERMNKEVLADVNVAPLIQYFVMSYKNDNLKNLSILDTPGFTSNDSKDAERTADVIKEADALFWVFDVNLGEVNQTSINVIREHLQGLPLFIVINKVDTKSPNELNLLEEHIKSTMKRAGIIVNGYIRFSHKALLGELLNAIDSVPHDDSKNQFLLDLYVKIIGEQNRLNNRCRDCLREEQKYERELNQYESDFEKYLIELTHNCDDVKKMPTYKEKFFGSDYYKMTKEEYGDFTAMLGRIEEAKTVFANIWNEQNVCAEKAGKASRAFEQIKKQRKIIDNCIKRFNNELDKWDSDFRKNLV